METRLGSLRLANPLIGAAGPFGTVSDVRIPDGLPALGAVVTTSVAYRARHGPGPALEETPAGAIVSPGTRHPGIKHVLRRAARAWEASASPIVVSIAGNTPAEYAAAAVELEGVRGVAAIELLIEDGTIAGDVVRSVHRACALPVWGKVRPDNTDLDPVLSELASAGAQAAVIGGGLEAHGAPTKGYLVGPATFPVVLGIVAAIAPIADLPIIAGGGITSPDHVRAYLRAGAAAVQVGSAQLANPLAAWQITAALLFPPASA